MTLIKSISGIRGTIGGEQGINLTPIDIVECTAAFGQWVLNKGNNPKIVVGRDGRMTGAMVSDLVVNTLLMQGIDVIDLGLSTTPTVEMAVPMESAGAGIILTASHNPKQWNALKFVDDKGEFISKADGEALLNMIDNKEMIFAYVDKLGKYEKKDDYIQKHIDEILKLDYLNVDLIKSKKYHVVVDAINSTGSLAIPPLLEAFGCTYTIINAEISGDFAHNPEPLPKHLTELCEVIVKEKGDLGISVDPDVDRLALVQEDGVCFGEEYTLVAVADSILSKKKGNTVSNLSSTRALADVTSKHGGTYTAAAVGEVNVVKTMKETKAVIGGEGNGGVILPDLHYGRDALAGIALVLNLMAEKNKKLSEIRKEYPSYTIVKNKVQLAEDLPLEVVFDKIKKELAGEKFNEIDGLKIDFTDGWVHLRASNTEPIVRLYAESASEERAQELVKLILDKIE